MKVEWELDGRRRAFVQVAGGKIGLKSSVTKMYCEMYVKLSNNSLMKQ